MSDRAFSLRFALYALAALVLSAALVLVLAQRSATRAADGQIARDARVAATMIAAAAAPGQPGRPLTATERAKLVRALRSAFAFAKVVRGGRVVLATDPRMLGPASAADAASARLALAGTAPAGHRSHAGGSDTIEAAAPIVVGGVAVGVLEVAQPWAPVAASIRHDFLLRAGAMLGGLLLLYAALFPILRRLLRDRRRAESGERLAEAIVENADEGIWVLDAESRIEFANPKLATLLGRERDEMVGRTIADFATTQPDGRARQELELRRSDGSTVWTLVSTHPLGEGGGAVVLVADIDDLKGTERSLHGATRRLRAIVAAQREIAGLELDLEATLTALLERTLELTGADAVDLVQAEGDEAVAAVVSGVDLPHAGMRIPIEGSLTGLCIRTRQVVTSSDIEHDPRAYGPLRADPTTRSAVLVPVRTESITGALSVIYGRKAGFDEETIETARLMAEFASATLRNAAELRAKQQLVAALAESEERFRNAVERSPIGFSLCTIDDRYIVVNEAFCRIVGRTRAGLDGLTWREITHPDDLGVEEDLNRRLLAGEIPHFEVEKRFVRGDGKTVWVRASIALVRGDDGKPRYSVAQVQDVTERLRLERSVRERERLFRAVFDQSLVGHFLLDDDGVIVDTNAAGAALLDLPREQVEGHRLAEFDPTGVVLEDAWRTLLREGTAHGEADVVTATGARRTIVFTCRANVQPGLHLVTDQDVTEQRQLEERSRQGQKMEAVGRLAGGIAHDFNNMLTAMIGYSDLMLAGLEEDSVLYDHAHRVNEAAHRSSALTRQLLAFSRRQVLRPAVVDPNAVVDRMRDMVIRLIGEDVRLETRLDPSAEPVLADESQLEQVLVNLAVNARDAMPQGGVLTVETATVNVDPDQARDAIAVPGRYSTVTIRDTGVGMDEEQLTRLFEPFYSTKGTAGVGLGLATVYGIARQSGGFVTVESEPGAGSSFRIYLPATAAPASSEPNAESDAPSSGSETVLLVEDEALVRGIVTEMLRQNGYAVLAAADGEEALRVAAEQPNGIDLLVTDVVMPGMSGQEVARRIAEARPSIRTLFVSGYNDGAIQNHGVLAPGTAFLQKPFSGTDLAAKVREVLDAAPAA